MAAGELIDTEPEIALAHTLVARRLASRIAAVREAVGLTAYRAGQWQTAIGELRAYHRMTGRQTHLAVLADCERALGRPERAVDMYRAADRDQLSPEEAVELLIVAAGARADIGQRDAAVAMLQVRELTSEEAWVARLRYAYADSLLAVDRRDEAREWFARAAEVDEDAMTDAAERLLELDGVVLDDGAGDDEDIDGPDIDGPGDDGPGDDESGGGDDDEGDDDDFDEGDDDDDGPDDDESGGGDDDEGDDDDFDEGDDDEGDDDDDDGPDDDGPGDDESGGGDDGDDDEGDEDFDEDDDFDGSDDDGSDDDGSDDDGSDDDGFDEGDVDDVDDDDDFDADRDDDDGDDDDDDGDGDDRDDVGNEDDAEDDDDEGGDFDDKDDDSDQDPWTSDVGTSADEDVTDEVEDVTDEVVVPSESDQNGRGVGGATAANRAGPEASDVEESAVDDSRTGESDAK
jgi:hypothetical protein